MALEQRERARQEPVDAAVVEGIAREVGTIALHHFHSLAGMPVEHKGHLDLVTRADREVEQALLTHLRGAFPRDGVYGEEGGNIPGVSGRVWVVDPIDGTFNFVRGSQNWGISIGLYQNHQPAFGVLYAPARNLMLSGGEGTGAKINGKPMPPLPPFDPAQGSMGIGIHPSIPTGDRMELIRYISDELRITFRCSGAATASLIEVATGQTDGYLSLGDSTWDVMAGLPILANLGVAHTIDWARTSLPDKLCFACGQEAFLARVRPFLDTVGHTPKQQQAVLVGKGDGKLR